MRGKLAVKGALKTRNGVDVAKGARATWCVRKTKKGTVQKSAGGRRGNGRSVRASVVPTRTQSRSERPGSDT